MARKEFINSLREASRLLTSPVVESRIGSNYDSRISAVLSRADLWLTPGSVKGFDPADFQDLSASEIEHSGGMAEGTIMDDQ
jgi:hypothetical protein